WHLARPLNGELPAGALRPVTAPLVLPTPAAADRETAVLEYLRTTRGIIEAQRQGVLGFLGGGQAGRSVPPQAPGPMSGAPRPWFSPPAMLQAGKAPPRLPAAGTGPASSRTPSVPPPRGSSPSVPPPRRSSGSIPPGQPPISAPRPSSPP